MKFLLRLVFMPIFFCIIIFESAQALECPLNYGNHYVLLISAEFAECASGYTSLGGWSNGWYPEGYGIGHLQCILNSTIQDCQFNGGTINTAEHQDKPPFCDVSVNTSWDSGAIYQAKSNFICGYTKNAYSVFSSTGNIYRCAAGYYGTPSSSTSGCNDCKVGTNNNAATSDVGDNSTISRCYLLNGATGSDPTGNFSVSGKCYYSN